MRFYCTIALSIFSFLAFQAQETSFTPYSRFGIGDLSANQFNRQFSMGGTGIAVYDYYGINPMNPGTYSYINEATFELGMVSNWFSLESQSEVVNGNVSRVNHVALGLPIRSKKIGITFGLLPLSRIGYNISSSDSISDFAFTQENLGSGGLNKLQLGLAKRFEFNRDTVKFNKQNFNYYYNSFSVGFNFDYVFGNRTNVSRSIFDPGLGAINTQISKIDNTSDIMFDLGVVYSTWIKKRELNDDTQIKLNLGGSFTPNTKLRSRRSRIVESFITSNAVEFTVDSILSEEDNRGEINLPMEFGLGAALEIYNKSEGILVLAADYKYRPWEEYYEEFAERQVFTELVNSSEFSVGFEFSPKWKLGKAGANISWDNYFQSLNYRAGAYLRQGYLNIEGEEFSESGINFGIGLPLVRARSRDTQSEINFGFGLSQRGSLDNALIKENNFELFIGVRLNPDRFQRWFVQRKYD